MSSNAEQGAILDAEALKRLAEQRDTRILLWVITALGALLRLWALNAKSFWLDEIASVVIARMPGNTFWHWLWTEEGNMALYYVMLRPWLGIHLGEGTIRLFSVLPGFASVPMMYLLGRRLFGRNAGLLAALLLALNTCAVVYSQEARGYSWLLLGTIISTYYFVRLIEEPTKSIASAYALAAGVTFYFHYFGLLVPLGHAVSLITVPNERQSWPQLRLAAAILMVFAVPVLWMISIQPGRHLDWVAKPSFLELYHIGVFLAAASGKAGGAVLLVLELVLLSVFFRNLVAIWKTLAGPGLWENALVASGLLTPVILSLLFSVIRPVFFHRFLIICLPFWLLAVVVGALEVPQRRWKNCAIAAVCVTSLVTTMFSYSRVREDWRGATNFLIDNARPQDIVVYYQGVGKFAAESYRDWLPGGGANRPVPVEVQSGSSDWRGKVLGARRVWLVQYPGNVSDDTSRAVEAELYSRYTRVASTPFRGITVTQFVAKP